MRDRIPEFEQRGAIVLGASPDSVESQRKFKKKFHLNFTLLADPDHAVAERYGVWQEKSFMGRKYMGVVRTTFLIDEKGTIARVFPNVKPDDHADLLLAAL